ncbi:hypothetical protein [Mesorhizobium quangtriensis]|uniref:hypothetical protein n=1 Tax=Mesorhizobium quangtriensis TaxID=3157709 RepID=UPI003CCD23CD
MAAFENSFAERRYAEIAGEQVCVAPWLAPVDPSAVRHIQILVGSGDRDGLRRMRDELHQRVRFAITVAGLAASRTELQEFQQGCRNLPASSRHGGRVGQRQRAGRVQRVGYRQPCAGLHALCSLCGRPGKGVLAPTLQDTVDECDVASERVRQILI